MGIVGERGKDAFLCLYLQGSAQSQEYGGSSFIHHMSE